MEVLGDLAMPNYEPRHPIENMEQPGLLQHPQEPPNDLHEPVQDQMAPAPQQQIILKRDDQIEYKAHKDDQWTQA